MTQKATDYRRKVLNGFQAVVLSLRKSARRRLRGEGDKPWALAIIRDTSDQQDLRGIFCAAGWELTIVDSVSSALGRLKRHPVPVILCERELPEGNWRTTVSALASLPGRPWIILLSCHCDQNLWDDVTRVGGSDILRTPLDRERVMRAVRSGWLLWRNLLQLRRATGSCS